MVMIKTPLKKISRNKISVVAYLFTIILSYILASIYSVSDVPLNWILKPLVQAFFLVSLITFMLAWLRDPGYIQKESSLDFLELLENFDPNSLCAECEVIRTQRSRHCNICNKCVNRFDHHCPWIDNCIGAGNHVWFYLYIISTFVYVTLVLTICS